MFIIFNKICFISLRAEDPATYIDTVRLVEKLSKAFDLVMVKVIPLFGFIGPKTIFCYFQYMTTDLGPDAFELPVAMW